MLRIDASGVVHCTNNSLLSSSTPESRVLVTVHGSYPPGKHNWHGAAASSDGTIVCVPNNVDTVLCIVPALNAAYSPALPYNDDDDDDQQKQPLVSPPEPELYILEGQSPDDIATGRHRTDGKYKYLGAMAGTDGHVYCFPSGSERVLQVDTCRRVARSVGPNLVGRERLSQNKWQNGLTSKQEGCVYAIPLAAETVLRIRTTGFSPSCVDEERAGQQLLNDDEPEVTIWKLPHPNKVLAKWEGGVMAKNGCIYCMPNNHKAILQIVPPCVPSREALHSARDEAQEELAMAMESQKQLRRQEVEIKKAEKEEKRQHRIERKNNEKKTRSLEAKGMTEKEIEKPSESGRSAEEDVNQAVNHSTQTDEANGFIHNEEFTPDGVPFVYKTGIPTLRSSAHRVKYSLDHRQHNPNPKGSNGNSTNTTLPTKLCNEDIFSYSTDEYNFHDAVIGMLQSCDEQFVGTFRSLADGTIVIPRLDNFVVPPETLTRTCQHGRLESAQEYLSDAVASDSNFLNLFDRFVVERVLPHIKKQLSCVLDEDNSSNRCDGPITFYYQRPPTMRIQPGPARAMVRPHHDAEYGRELLYCSCFHLLVLREVELTHAMFLHPDQNGELNFWLPLTCRRKTGVDLWCESKSDAGDFHPVKVEYGEVASFHGSSCRHYVNPNHSLWTRVSLDFRVGVEGYFDPEWQMNGTTKDHDRMKVTL